MRSRGHAYAGRGSGVPRHRRTDLLTHDDPGYVALLGEVEDDHLDVVVAAEADRRRIGDLEPPGEELVVRQMVELDRVRVELGVGVVHTVDALLAHQDHLGADFESALGGDRVGGEVRHAGARTEDHHPTFVEVTHRPARDVGLRDLAHRDRGLHPGLHSLLLEEVLERETVHHGAQHAHVVGAGTVHATLLQLSAAEEVPAADHDRDLDAAADHRRDLAGHGVDDVGIDTDPPTAEDLPGELEQHALVCGHGRSFARWFGARSRRARAFRDGGLVATCRPDTQEGRSVDLVLTANGPASSLVYPRWSTVVGRSAADLEPGEALHAHAGLVEDRLDVLLRLLHRRLVEQRDVLEEPVEATLDDPGKRLLGFALLACRRLGDLALLGDHVGGHLVAGDVQRPHRGDLHRGGAGRLLVVGGVLDEHSDGGRQARGAAVHGRRNGPGDHRHPG